MFEGANSREKVKCYYLINYVAKQSTVLSQRNDVKFMFKKCSLNLTRNGERLLFVAQFSTF